MATIKLNEDKAKQFREDHKTVSTRKVQPHSRKRDYGVPLERPCGFPSSDTNMNRSNGKTQAHPLKLWKFKSTSKKDKAKHQ